MKLQVWIKVYCLLIGFRQHPDRNRASSRGREEALCRIVLPWVTQSSSVEFWIRDTRVLNPRSTTSLASATIIHLRKVLRGTPVTSRGSSRVRRLSGSRSSSRRRGRWRTSRCSRSVNECFIPCFAFHKN